MKTHSACSAANCRPRGEVPAWYSTGVRCGDDGWTVSEYEEGLQLRPGLEQVARVVLGEMMRLGHGQPLHYLAKNKLRNNPAWPAELAAVVGRLRHERYVLLLPVALSRSQDDKGRLRWTLFGASEQGPSKAFWRGFFTAPGVEAPWSEAEGFFVELLSRGYGVRERQARAPAGAGPSRLCRPKANSASTSLLGIAAGSVSGLLERRSI